MQLQNKILLTWAVMFILVIAPFGVWVARIIEQNAEEKGYAYLQATLQSYVTDVLDHRHGILVRNKVQSVPSFVQQYKEAAIEAAKDIKHPEPVRLLIFDSKGKPVFFPSEADNEASVELWQSVAPVVMALGHGELAHGCFRDEKYYVGTYYAPWEWFVLNTLDHASVHEELWEVRKAALLWGGISIFVSIAFLTLATRHVLLRPIHDLREAATSIATGAFVEKINVDSRDDLGKLARDMEAMSSSIQEKEQALLESKTELERRVQERTLELGARNEELRCSEQRYALLFQEIMDGFVILEPILESDGSIMDFRFLAVNPAFEAMTGLPVSEINNGTLRDVFPYIDEFWIEKYAHVALTGKSAVFERYLQSLDKHFEIKAYRSNPGQVAVVMSDISERKHALEKLQESEAALRKILEGIGAALLIVEPKSMTIVEANDMAAQLFARPRETLVGSCVLELHWLDAFGRPLDSQPQDYGDITSKEYFISLPDGSRRPVLRTVITCTIGGRLQLVEILLDMTKQKSLEHQLAHSHKLEAIGQLAAGIAHEINTPIQYVAGNLGFVLTAFEKVQIVLDSYAALHRAANLRENLDRIAADVTLALETTQLDFLLEEVPQAIADSQEGMERVATIVRAMKQFSHPDIVEMKAVDINEAIKNTVVVARNEWKYDSELHLELAEDLPHVFCVPGDFNQAVLNVLVNAAHANADMVSKRGGKGSIAISTALSGESVEIRISDTGSGIPKNIQDKIFNPFFTTKEVGRGTGQGLAITHSIVDKHGGSIFFESTPGQGTTFVLLFPLEPWQVKGKS